MICVLWSAGGTPPFEAINAEEALAAAHRERPAAVLLDVQLAGASGYAICRELRDQFGEQLRSSSCRERGSSRRIASPGS